MKNSIYRIVLAVFLFFAAAPIVITAQVNLQEGLIIYYAFSGDANDESGNGYHGIVQGATLTEDRHGEPDKAYLFNKAEEDHILVSVMLPDMTQLSISVWIYLMETDENATIICDATTDPGNDFLMNVTNGSIGIRADKNDAALKYEDGAVFDLNISGAWHHLAWLMGASQSSIYLDGELVFYIEETANQQGYHADQASLGRRFVLNTGDFYFDGKMDEFRLYDRLLTLEEVQALAEISSGLQEISEKLQIKVFPNPSGGVSHFAFHISQYQWVSLKVFDLHGREVAVVLDEKLPAGEHVVRYDMTGLPAGVYVVGLRAKGIGHRAVGKVVKMD